MKKLNLLPLILAFIMSCRAFSANAILFSENTGVQETSFAGMGNSNEELARAYYKPTSTNPSISYNLYGATEYLTRIRIYARPYDSTIGVNNSGLSVTDMAFFDYRDPINKNGAFLIGETTTIGNGTITPNVALTTGKQYVIYLTADIIGSDKKTLPLMNAGSNFTKVGGLITKIGDSNITTSSAKVDGNRTLVLKRKLLYTPGDYYSKYYRIPAMAKASDGSLVAISDARKYHIHDIENDIDMLSCRSTDNGVTWSSPVTIAKGSGGYEGMPESVCLLTTGYGDAALASLPNGNLICTMVSGYRLGGSPSDRATTNWYTISRDNGKTWSSLKEIPNTVYNSERGCIAPGNMCVVKYGILQGKILACFRSYKSGNSATNYNYFLIYDPATDKWSRMGSSIKISSADDEAHLVEIDANKFLMSIRDGNRVYAYVSIGGTASSPTYSYTTVSSSMGLSVACNSDIISYTDGTGVKYLIQSLPYESASDSYSHSTRSGNNITTATSYNGGSSIVWTKRINISDPLNSRVETAQYSSLTVQEDGSIGVFYEEYPLIAQVTTTDNRGDYLLSSWYMNFRIGDIIPGATTTTSTTTAYTAPTISPVSQTYDLISSDRPQVTISQTNGSSVTTYYLIQYYLNGSDAVNKTTATLSFTGNSKSFSWSDICTALGISDVVANSYIRISAYVSGSNTTSVIYSFRNNVRKLRVVPMPVNNLGDITLSSVNMSPAGPYEVFKVAEGETVTLNAPGAYSYKFIKYTTDSLGTSALSSLVSSYSSVNKDGYQVQFAVPKDESLYPTEANGIFNIYAWYNMKGGLYTKVKTSYNVKDNTSLWCTDSSVKTEPTVSSTLSLTAPSKADNSASMLYYYNNENSMSATMDIIPDAETCKNINLVVLARIGNQYIMNGSKYKYALLNGRNYSYPYTSTLYSNAFSVADWYTLSNGTVVPVAQKNIEWNMFTSLPNQQAGDKNARPTISIDMYAVASDIASVEDMLDNSKYLYKVTYPINFNDVTTAVNDINSQNDELVIYSDGDGVVLKTSKDMSVTIVDMLGRVVNKAMVNGEEHISLPKGVYMANNKKFIVK